MNKSVNILLIEDNPDHAELIIRSFQNFQGTDCIYHIADGATALDYLFRRGKYAAVKDAYPQVVLLDLRLPKIDGLHVLGELKADPKLRCIPVVILTTSDADRDLDRAYQLYVNSYLVKPVDLGGFKRLMCELGSYWLGWNRRPGASRAALSGPV